jgi:hypothetical protein
MSIINAALTPGASIKSSEHNQNYADIGTEITNSVAADGQTTITGQMKGAAGSVAAPAYSFSSDLDTGLYHIGANNIGLGVNGAKVLDIGTAGLGVTGTLSSTSDFAINTSKFTVAASSGNSVVAGTLGVTGDVAVNTNKFNVTAASGNTTVAGTLGVTSDVAVNTNKFTVAASSGNTVVAGTLNVTGLSTLSGGISGIMAAKSDQGTAASPGASTTLAVNPGVQQFHPSAAKCWLKANSSNAVVTSYNITSTTNTGTGIMDVTIGTDFSTSNFCSVVSASIASNISANTDPSTGLAAGTVRVLMFNTNSGAAASSATALSCYGDQ